MTAEYRTIARVRSGIGPSRCRPPDACGTNHAPISPDSATGPVAAAKSQNARWSGETSWKRRSSGNRATPTIVMRASTRFHRRAVMQRTSTISDSAAPATITAKKSGPSTGFTSVSSPVADPWKSAT